MSTWISERRSSGRAAALALILALPLAACVGEGTGPGGMGFLSPPDTEADKPAFRPLRQVSLFGGEVVVAGPAGYCLDGSSLRKRMEGTVIVIASCEALSGQVGTAVEPAVMTVSVGPRRPGVTQPGAAALAGSMAPVKVLRAEEDDGLALVRLESGGDGLIPEGDPRYWRGAAVVNDHVISLAAYTPKDAGLPEETGRTLILALAEAIRTRSRQN